jgi:hypothetical protein
MTGPFSQDAFEARRMGLEEEYFRTRDAGLVAKLKTVFSSTVDKEDLRKATGIDNEEVLDQLVAAHVKGEMLTAFKLYPLIEIAWADGSVDAREREAIVRAAVASGIPTDGVAYERLLEWLEKGPTENARAVWRSYAKELAKKLTKEEMDTFRRDLIGYAKAVAEASGGILGVIYRTSPGEQRVIDEMERCLTA